MNHCDPVGCDGIAPAGRILMLLLRVMLQIERDSQTVYSVNGLSCVELCNSEKDAPKRGAACRDELRQPSKPDPILRLFQIMENPATSGGFDDRVVDATGIDSVPALLTRV